MVKLNNICNFDLWVLRMFKLLFLQCFFSAMLTAIALPSVAEDYAAIYPTYRNYTVTSSSKDTVLLTTYSYQQTTAYTCGPAVVMSLLHYYGMLNRAQMNHVTEMRLANEMGTTQEGTSQQNMVNWLENHGFNVSYGQGVTIDMLVKNIDRGIPTIITWNDWNGHSILVVGYQAKSNENGEEEQIFLADPETSSSITKNQTRISGINTLTVDDLQLNWFNARYFFNPSHTAIGMYIVAVPKK